MPIARAAVPAISMAELFMIAFPTFCYVVGQKVRNSMPGVKRKE